MFELPDGRGACPSFCGAPQLEQKALPLSICAPHFLQYTDTTCPGIAFVDYNGFHCLEKEVPETVWHGGGPPCVLIHKLIDEHTERIAIAEGTARENL